jgi:formylmethanofuran dehydrogenase subunit C
MPLELRYQADTSIPVEIEGLTPEAVRDKSLDEIRRWEIFHGNRKLPLGEMFTVEGDPSDLSWEMHGNLAGVHWIGAQMREGSIHVHGPAGRHVGSEMRGGRIEVDGDAGDWVGGEMHGGVIYVHGWAGHLVGAAYRGSRKGMTGGTILIEGDAGNEIGHTMRRGLIAIGGAAGDMIAFNMLAGTVLVFGEAGIRPGAGMRRGTVGLFGPTKPQLLPTFRYACRYEPVVLSLLHGILAQHGFAHEDVRTVDLYNGDLLDGGRGEVLLKTYS